MNERIKELALECYNPYSNFDHEKFAQLIVQESISTLEHRYKWDGDVSDGNEVKKCIAKIKQHFGVNDA